MSPVLFAVYLDCLLVELRNHGVGCHDAGVWFGAACYADDLILLSPSRTAMAMMLEVCEKYATTWCSPQILIQPSQNLNVSTCVVK